MLSGRKLLMRYGHTRDWGGRGVTRSGRAVCRWTSRGAACCTKTGRHGGRRHGAAGAPSHPGVEDALAGALLEGSLGERAVRRVAVEGAALLLRPRLHVRVHRGEPVALAAVPRVVEHENASGDLGAAREARGRRGGPPEKGTAGGEAEAPRGRVLAPQFLRKVAEAAGGRTRRRSPSPTP